MGVGFFIVLDQPDVDAFVNGKAMAREARRLGRSLKSKGIKSPEEFVSISSDERAEFADAMDAGVGATAEAEGWFRADEGLAWVAAVRNHLQANQGAAKDVDAVIADLDEYEQVFTRAKAAGARWRLSIDY